MVEYRQIDEDSINKTESITTLYDLKDLVEKLKELRKVIQSIEIKTTLDQETLEYYTRDRNMHRNNFVQEAKGILKQIKEIYDAGYLPNKYVQPLLDFNQWLNNL